MSSKRPEYKPLSRDVLLAQKKCCGQRCANCPYVPKYVKGSTAADTPGGAVQNGPALQE